MLYLTGGQSDGVPLSACNLDDVVCRKGTYYLGCGLDALAQLMTELTVGVGAPAEDLTPLIDGKRVGGAAGNTSYLVGVQAIDGI